eukprot:scaffold103397_cov66-Phaeocystis_antarctica.AAC.3
MLPCRLSKRLCAQCWCSKSVTIRMTCRLNLPLEAAGSLSASPSDVAEGSCAEVAREGRARPWFQSLESASRHTASTNVRLLRHEGRRKASCT